MSLIGTPNITNGGGLDIIHTLRFPSTEWTSFEWKKTHDWWNNTILDKLLAQVIILISSHFLANDSGPKQVPLLLSNQVLNMHQLASLGHTIFAQYCSLIVLHCYNINMMDCFSLPNYHFYRILVQNYIKLQGKDNVLFLVFFTETSDQDWVLNFKIDNQVDLLHFIYN